MKYPIAELCDMQRYNVPHITSGLIAKIVIMSNSIELTSADQECVQRERWYSRRSTDDNQVA